MAQKLRSPISSLSVIMNDSFGNGMPNRLIYNISVGCHEICDDFSHSHSVIVYVSTKKLNFGKKLNLPRKAKGGRKFCHGVRVSMEAKISKKLKKSEKIRFSKGPS